MGSTPVTGPPHTNAPVRCEVVSARLDDRTSAAIRTIGAVGSAPGRSATFGAMGTNVPARTARSNERSDPPDAIHAARVTS